MLENIVIHETRFNKEAFKPYKKLECDIDIEAIADTHVQKGVEYVAKELGVLILKAMSNNR